MKLIIFILYSSIFLEHLQAQEVNKLESIHIYNLKEQSSVNETHSDELYDSSVIEETLPSSLDDILKISPGATTSGGPRSSGEQIQIRGLGAKKLFIYIDGVKQGFSTDHSSMIAMDTDNLKSIEIYKSTSEVSKSGSLGGGIIFQTKDAKDYLRSGERFGSSYKISHQTSNDEVFMSAKTYSQIQNNDFIIGISSRKADDTVLSDRTTLSNSGYEDVDLHTKYKNQLNSHESFQINANLFTRKDSAPLNPTLNPPLEIEELNGDNNITRLSFSLKYLNNPKFNRLLNLKSNLSMTKQTLEKTRKSDKQYELRELESTGASISNAFNFKNVQLNTGIEFIEDKLNGLRNTNKLASYPGGRSHQNNFFTQLNFNIKKRIDFKIGLRFQDYKLESDNPKHKSKKSKALSKMISSSLTIIEGLKFNTTYSEGFNAPKIQDVYVDGLHHRGDGFFISDNYFITNYHLEHETSKMLEIGIKYQKSLFNSEDLLTIKLNRYWNNAKNYIYYQKTDRAIYDNAFGTTQFINIPNVSLKGREFGFDYIYDRINFAITYTQVRGINKNKELYLSDMPADQYTYSFKLYFDDMGVTLGYNGIQTLKQDRINSHTIERTDETPGYFTHNVFLTKDFSTGILRDISLGTRVENLTNRQYRKHASHINEVGLDLKFNIKYQLKHF